MVATIAAATVATTFVLWKLMDLLPMVFATILVALAWRGGGQRVAARLGLSQGLALGVVALTLAASVVLGLFLFGGQLVRQYDEIGLDIPDAIGLIGRAVEEHPWGHFVEKFLADVDVTKAAAPVAQHLATLFGVLRQRPRVRSFHHHRRCLSCRRSKTLCLWRHRVYACVATAQHGAVLGSIQQRFAPMASHPALCRRLSNAFFAGVALWAFGVPAPLALATISGALAFIPYFGSIIALIVGGVALPHGLESAALAALAIGSASFVEGYLITPYLQSRSLMVPPVVLLFSMLAFGSLFGAMGVVLAVPATVVLAIAYGVFKKPDEPMAGAGPLRQAPAGSLVAHHSVRINAAPVFRRFHALAVDDSHLALAAAASSRRN